MRNSPLPQSRAACTNPASRRTFELGARYARIKRKVDDCRGKHDVLHAVAERGDNAHGQNEQRKGHDGVGDAADDAIGPSAEEAGRDTGEPTHQKNERHGSNRNEEIEPRGHGHAAEDVATELIGPAPVGERRWLERDRGIAGERIIRDEVGTKHRGEHDQNKEPEGKAGDHVLAEDVAGMAKRSEKTAVRNRTVLGERDRSHDSNLTRGSMTP